VSPQQIGFLGIAALLALLALGCPVGIAMIMVGFAGFAAIIGIAPALNILETGAFETASNYSFTLVPLFLLMGSLVSRAGLSRDLFLAARRFTNGWNGGLAVAGVTASAAFSAVSGSSLATASTMTRVAYPEMRAQGYDPRLAAGSLAAGGTLGIMIPPSIALLLYALITEQSVGAMFLAGFLPGLLAFALYVVCVTVMARIWRPSDEHADADPGPLGLALRRLVFALYRGLRWPDLLAALRETVQVSATIFVILIGAEVFGYLLSVSQISFAMADMIRDAGWRAGRRGN
jgi:TRAP-type C4-dicarboxylate transport system permease large subunit